MTDPPPDAAHTPCRLGLKKRPELPIKRAKQCVESEWAKSGLVLTGLTKIEGDCCAFLLHDGISVHRGSRSICPFVDVSAGEHDRTQHHALQYLSITTQQRSGTCWNVQQLLSCSCCHVIARRMKGALCIVKQWSYTLIPTGVPVDRSCKVHQMS